MMVKSACCKTHRKEFIFDHNKENMLNQALFTKTNAYKNQFHAAKPFPHVLIKNFLEKNTAKKLLKALGCETFSKKESDLFTFYQTCDLISSNDALFKEFRESLLSQRFISLLETITNIKLSNKRIDLFGSLYQQTHYLLAHDDQLGKRKIAFIYYLTTLKAKDGGALSLYASNEGQPTTIAKRIQPTANTFLFFEVSPQSFHEVEEVLTATPRISLTGWFY